MAVEQKAVTSCQPHPEVDADRTQSVEMSGSDRSSMAVSRATKTGDQSTEKADISSTPRGAQRSSVVAAGALVMGLLPQIGGWAIGLSCFAYLAGQRETSSYLGTLGAPWAMSLLSPTQLMQAGAVPATTVVLFGFVAFKYLLAGTSERRLQHWSIALFGIGLLLFFASCFDQRAASKLRWVEGSTAFILASGGVTVGELVASLRQTGEWGFQQVSFIDVIVLTSLLGSSSFLGTARAEADGVRGASALPIVSLAGKDTQPWRLVFGNGDKLLLMSPAASKAERQFKIVGASDVDAVMGT